MLIEAARAGIPSVGLQHGMIFENNYDYMHVDTGHDSALSAFTVPRKTCVWGELWREALTGNGTYPTRRRLRDRKLAVRRHRDHPGLARVGTEPHSVSQEKGPNLVLACSGAQESIEFVQGRRPRGHEHRKPSFGCGPIPRRTWTNSTRR